MPRRKLKDARPIDPGKLKHAWKHAGKKGYAAKAISSETKPRALKTPANATFDRRNKQDRKIQDKTKEDIDKSTPYRLVTVRVKAKHRKHDSSDSSDDDDDENYKAISAANKAKRYKATNYDDDSE